MTVVCIGFGSAGVGGTPVVVPMSDAVSTGWPLTLTFEEPGATETSVSHMYTGEGVPFGGAGHGTIGVPGTSATVRTGAPPTSTFVFFGMSLNCPA